uniref:Rho GAP n=1 Tax=Trepomonas sp. PC1 TaxID=1076344 RepID=A0A146K1Y6_9EUKA|eukprot:JAP90912.1 Rho GAP [Trepomonas sp. PC1]
MDFETFEILFDQTSKFIETNCLHEIGVYRVPGNIVEVKELYLKYKNKELVNLSQIQDKFTIASLLKYSLTHLTNPLVPRHLYPMFRAIIVQQDLQFKDQNIIQKIKQQIPLQNQKLIKKLVTHFYCIINNSENNQMSIDNIMIVLGPSFLKSYESDLMDEAKANPRILKLIFEVFNE